MTQYKGLYSSFFKPSPPGVPNPAVQEVLSFPSAVGFARNARGAAAYTGPRTDIQILNIDNLNDGGAGSAEVAIESAQPSLVIPRVGGLVGGTGGIAMTNPFKTIGLQTAPGDGLVFSGRLMRIQASEIILRGLRLRRQAALGSGVDGLEVLGGAFGDMENIMIDHCSVSGASDENFASNGLSARINKITFSRCISAWPLNDLLHGMGMLINKSGVEEAAVVLNYFAHVRERAPQLARSMCFLYVANNYTYNWQNRGCNMGTYLRADVVGNSYDDGADANGTRHAMNFSGAYDDTVYDGGTAYGKFNSVVSEATALYQCLQDNTGNLPSTSPLFWEVLPGLTTTEKTKVFLEDNLDNGVASLNSFEDGATSSRIFGSSHGFDVGYSRMAASLVKNHILDVVGLNVGAPHRDQIDIDAINDGINDTGSLNTAGLTLPTYNNANNSVYPANNLGIHLDWLVSNGYAVDTTAAAAMSKDDLLQDGSSGYMIAEEFMNDPMHFTIS